MKNEIKFYHAYDENGNIINIYDVTKDNRAKKYYCIGCNNEMCAVLGSVRKHQFRHKGECCSYESYLHKLSKKLLKEKFNSQKEFIIKYIIQYLCERAVNCKIEQLCSTKCNRTEQHELDLKKFYDLCEEEKTYNGFRTDLMLSNSKDSNKLPLFIEISVTHDCEQSKLESGIPIIEIKITDEEVLQNIMEETFLTDIENDIVRFYNFKKVTQIIPLDRIWISNDKDDVLRAYIVRNGQDGLNCRNVENNHRQDSIYEIAVPSNIRIRDTELDTGLFGLIKAVDSGLDLKYCDLCSHYNDDCILNIPIIDKQTGQKAIRALYVSQIQNIDKNILASSCGKYSKNIYYIRTKLNQLNKVPYWEWKKEND